jgi:[ribosomal protein S5]-alanine N-acetyltransferase
LGLVLLPKHWGLGIPIFKAFVREAFETHHFRSIVIALPESRTSTRALSRVGFQKDGDFNAGSALFHRWRLENPNAGDG